MRPVLYNPSFPSAVQVDFPGTVIPLLINDALQSLHLHQTSYHAMTASYLRNLLFLLDLFVVIARCANLNISGEAVTTRFWDCCKPSCGWNGKASFNRPVLSCTADDKPTDIQAGTGCGDGGTAFLCSDQQPWAVNDTFSYGFAGIFLVPSLTDNHIEDAWCCACYQLNFTSDPLRGKTMIVQASNTAYDVNTANRFSLAVSDLSCESRLRTADCVTGTGGKYHLT